MKPTIDSLNIVRTLAKSVQTFHHHYHLLYDIAMHYYGDQQIQYVEIGAYAGGSACLMLQRPNTAVISIDLGTPIDPVITKNNAEQHRNNNVYQYILGDSGSQTTKQTLKNSLTKKIDILFIDGDHSYAAVQRDFQMYEDLLEDDAFVVFDDYNDRMYSPQVKLAVDDMISTVADRYHVIGTMANILGASPSEITEGNCFVIRRIH